MLLLYFVYLKGVSPVSWIFCSFQTSHVLLRMESTTGSLGGSKLPSPKTEPELSINERITKIDNKIVKATCLIRDLKKRAEEDINLYFTLSSDADREQKDKLKNWVCTRRQSIDNDVSELEEKIGVYLKEKNNLIQQANDERNNIQEAKKLINNNKSAPLPASESTQKSHGESKFSSESLSIFHTTNRFQNQTSISRCNKNALIEDSDRISEKSEPLKANPRIKQKRRRASSREQSNCRGLCCQNKQISNLEASTEPTLCDLSANMIAVKLKLDRLNQDVADMIDLNQMAVSNLMAEIKRIRYDDLCEVQRANDERLSSINDKAARIERKLMGTNRNSRILWLDDSANYGLAAIGTLLANLIFSIFALIMSLVSYVIRIVGPFQHRRTTFRSSLSLFCLALFIAWRLYRRFMPSIWKHLADLIQS
ncbi:hypothetical protein ACOME3_006576 [Neoechinorhynchus agilis]